ncbi:hypothetical protein Tco_1094201 [Tanacetum coccineum]|uniref:Uncharacterized protein n=1 Tax=Tanacetum coccineum TaxID=301880 RepID=A0ABQ5IEW8_9ASTR
MKSIRRIQKTSIRRIQGKEYNILEDIKRGPYSKKSPIRRIQLLGYAVCSGGRGGWSVDVVSVVSVTLEGTSTDAVRALKI